eukprot:NODE_293_length_11597_cov_0.181771.p2 type:complete len:417 gc:universal NODE_293_length_11597_cov_0.181771:6959-5709(-)
MILNEEDSKQLSFLAIKKEHYELDEQMNWKDFIVLKDFGKFEGTEKEERFICACSRKFLIKRGLIVEHVLEHIRKLDKSDLGSPEIETLSFNVNYLTSLLETKKHNEEEDATYFELLKEFGTIDEIKNVFVCLCCNTENALSSIAITRHLRRCENMHSLHKISYNLKNDMWRMHLGRVVPFSPVATFSKTPINREEINGLQEYKLYLRKYGQLDATTFTCPCVKKCSLNSLFDIIEHILGCRKYKLKEKCEFIEGLIIATKAPQKVDYSGVPQLNSNRRLEPITKGKYTLPSMNTQLRGIDNLSFSQPQPQQLPNSHSLSSGFQSQQYQQRLNLPGIGEKRESSLAPLSSSPSERQVKMSRIGDEYFDNDMGYHEKALKVSENQLERVRLIQQVVKSILEAPPENQKDLLDAIRSM